MEDISLFEYGGGYSIIWHADRIDRVSAVGHAAEWVKEIESEIPANGEILHRTDKTAYTEEIANHADVDVAVIDGKHRQECLEPTMAALSDEGVIVWDDYHRYEEDKDEVFKQLFDSGFSVLPFYGLKGLNAHYRCTAILYRDDNCLGI